jgi:hypothetical protein
VRGAVVMGRHPKTFTSPEVSRFIDRFVGAFFLDKASRFVSKRPAWFSSSFSHNTGPIVE